MRAEDDFEPSSDTWPESYMESRDGKWYIMYHGTSRAAAEQIMANGFRQSSDGILGQGVYVSRDLQKANKYPLNLPKHEKVVLKLRVNVGRVKKIDYQGHPMQKTWHTEHGYDTAWCPPNCGMLPSGMEEDCVWDPQRITVICAMYPKPDSSGGVPDDVKIPYTPNTKILGRGASGTVVGTFQKRKVAVKRMLRDHSKLALTEVELLLRLDDHPHVIRYFANWVDNDFQYIILELCSSTLQTYIEEKKDRKNHVTFLQQTMSGLFYLHSLKIVHRDLKPSNILLSVIDFSGGVKAKISDFGLGKQMDMDRNSYSNTSGEVGSLCWMAPEVINRKSDRLGCSVDIFSAGSVIYFVLSEGGHPFGTSTLDIIKNISHFQFTLDKLNPHTHAHVLARPLIERMLSMDPNARPSAQEALDNPLFWDAWDQLDYIQDASDMLISEKAPSDILTKLEANSSAVFQDDWMNVISEVLKKDLTVGKSKYDGTKVQHLLRAIRNKKHHHTAELLQELGPVPDGFMSYFTSRFPNLLLHTYSVLCECGIRPKFIEQEPKTRPRRLIV
ncbi:hypothetical protein JZ751_019287 [Albula glossodonta]|uniref:non-specific serine/threonine protein kinase n=1 Tax=Albula glossodonta TaxID=121402 RepID=A0A8T2NYL0_9TELE|nr:hypothetical protein JZ751_019287 [Albula glossodonta]